MVDEATFTIHDLWLEFRLFRAPSPQKSQVALASLCTVIALSPLGRPIFGVGTQRIRRARGRGRTSSPATTLKTRGWAGDTQLHLHNVP